MYIIFPSQRRQKKGNKFKCFHTPSKINRKCKKHIKGHMMTFQFIWWRKPSGAHPCNISGTNRHLSRHSVS
jgi:hypothetical protein